MKYNFPLSAYHDFREMVQRFEDVIHTVEFNKGIEEPKKDQSLSSYREQYGENAGKIIDVVGFILRKIDANKKHFSTNVFEVTSRYRGSNVRYHIEFKHIIEEDKNFCLQFTIRVIDSREIMKIDLIRKKRYFRLNLNREIIILSDDICMENYLKFKDITTVEDVITKYDEISISSILGFYLSSKKGDIYFDGRKVMRRDFPLLTEEYNIPPE